MKYSGTLSTSFQPQDLADYAIVSLIEVKNIKNAKIRGFEMVEYGFQVKRQMMIFFVQIHIYDQLHCHFSMCLISEFSEVPECPKVSFSNTKSKEMF